MKLLFLSALLGFTFAFSSCGNKDSTESSELHDLPNIVLLMGDDHGWDEVGYNGHPHVKTPVLDDMASQGLRFDRFYSGHPSCSPTRGSFITGRHPNRYGTFSPNWSMRPEEVSVAHILKDAGYATAHLGKWHLGPVKSESPTSPGAMGFDEWLSHDNFFEMDPVLSRNGAAPQQIEGEGSEILIDEAIQFIKKSTSTGKPFFIVVWYGSPHEPYSGLQKDLELYDDIVARYSSDSTRLTSNETGRRTQRPLGEVLRERYAEITAMDRSIGTLRDFLSKEGLKENTLLWYCGDNGTPPSANRTGMTMRAQKGTMYEGGIRVPGIIEWPAQINNPAITQAVSVTTDILPTLSAIAGQSLPERPLDGINLLPVVAGKQSERPTPLYFWSFESNKVFGDDAIPYIDPAYQEGTTPLVKMMGDKYTRTFRNFVYPEVSSAHTGGDRVMMKGKYKLVLDANRSEDSSVELFDISVDPAETINLAEQETELVKEMQKEMHEWQMSVLKSLTGADYY